MKFWKLIPATAVATWIAWAATGSAATYYVSPSGSATNPGTQPSPWSLSKANASLIAGDVEILLPGNYGSSSIAPAASGTSYSRFIAFVGSVNNPASTVVAGVNFGSRSYVSVKGVQVNSDVTFTGTRDSIAWCRSPSGMIRGQLGGDDCVAAYCTFTGGSMAFNGGQNAASPPLLARDTLSYCTFNISLSGNGPCFRINATDRLVFRRCRWFMNNTTSGDGGLFKMYGGRNGKFIDCLFDIQNQRPWAGCDECGIGYIRDYSIFNVFLRDTFLLHGPQPIRLMLSASGSFPGTNRGNKWDSCVFRQDAAGSVAMINWQNGARADTVINCVGISRGLLPAQFDGFYGNCLVKNNTFIQLASPGNAAQVLGWSGTNYVYNNIFYTVTGGSGQGGAALDHDGTGVWTGNNNLYYCANPSGSSIYVAGAATGPGSGGRLCTGSGADCASRYGDPRFVGGSTVMNFNPTLTTGSAAIGAGVGGVDIGAIPFGPGGSDVTPPAPIGNMAAALVSDDKVQLTWTATGDDGTIGRATAYEIRRSAVPITALNFSSSTLVPNSLTPQAAGSTEQFLVQGLTPGTLVFFALKAIDDASNSSLISNVLSLTTLVSDTIPPGAVQDLSAGP